MAKGVFQARAALTSGDQTATEKYPANYMEGSESKTSPLQHSKLMSSCGPKVRALNSEGPKRPAPSPRHGTKRVPAQRWRHVSRPHGVLRNTSRMSLSAHLNPKP